VLILGILISIGIIFTPAELFAQTDDRIIESVTEQHIKLGNQTITQVYVTINDESEPLEGYLIASATIIAFSGIGSVLAIRFQKTDYNKQLKIAYVIYGSIYVIIAAHLFAILSIALDFFDGIYYAIVILISFVFFFIIIVGFTKLTRYQKQADDERSDEKHHADRHIQDSRDKILASEKKLAEEVMNALRDLEELKEEVRKFKD